MMLLGGPARLAAADLAHEALQDRRALARVRDLGMKLHAVEAPRAHRPSPRYGASCGAGDAR